MNKTRRTFLRKAGMISAATVGGLNVASASPRDGERQEGTTAAPKEVLCAVTGQIKSGKSIIVSHEAIKPVTVGMMPGVQFYRIGGSDTIVKLPSDGSPPSQPQFFPPKNGFRFGMFSLPPTTIGFAAVVSESQNVLAVHLVIQCIETKAGRFLCFVVQRLLQTSERFLGLIDSASLPPSSSLLAFPFN